MERSEAVHKLKQLEGKDFGNLPINTKLQYGNPESLTRVGLAMSLNVILDCQSTPRSLQILVLGSLK